MIAVATRAGCARPLPPLSGRAEAVDGDTLRLGATRIRLIGLDAPELDQTCRHRWHAMDLRQRARGRFSSLSSIAGRRTANRRVTIAMAGSSRTAASMAAILGLRSSPPDWAVVDFDYGAEEAAARAARRGIWAGDFDHSGRMAPAATAAANRGCGTGSEAGSSDVGRSLDLRNNIALSGRFVALVLRMRAIDCGICRNLISKGGSWRWTRSTAKFLTLAAEGCDHAGGRNRPQGRAVDDALLAPHPEDGRGRRHQGARRHPRPGQGSMPA